MHSVFPESFPARKTESFGSVATSVTDVFYFDKHVAHPFYKIFEKERGLSRVQIYGKLEMDGFLVDNSGQDKPKRDCERARFFFFMR